MENGSSAVWGKNGVSVTTFIPMQKPVLTLFQTIPKYFHSSTSVLKIFNNPFDHFNGSWAQKILSLQLKQWEQENGHKNTLNNVGSFKSKRKSVIFFAMNEAQAPWRTPVPYGILSIITSRFTVDFNASECTTIPNPCHLEAISQCILCFHTQSYSSLRRT